MMDILLVSANRERNPYPVFPLGLSYLAGPLAAQGHRLRLIDLCFAQDPLKEMDQAVAAFRPSVVIVSIRNIDNLAYPGKRSYLAGIREVVDSVRGRATVIVGGSGFSLMPLQLLEYLGAEYGVVGEGEAVLPELLSRLALGLPAHTLPGVVVKGAQSFLPPEHLATIGEADRSLFQVGRYHHEGGMANIQTKRGCPFSCIYCIYPLLEGNRVRLRPIGDIIAEIRSLVDDHGVSYLYFVDDVFNYPPAFAEDLCRAMAREKLPVNWSAFVNPRFVAPRLVEAMVAAGCDAVEFGTESGSPQILRNLGKTFTVGQVREASRFCREAGADFAHFLLFGGPGESEATIDETCSLMDELGASAVIAMTGIRIFPGTGLYRQAIKDGIITAQTPLLEPVFYIAPAVRETLCETVAQRAQLRKNWVAPGMEANLSDAMLEALRRFPVRGPKWKNLKRLDRSGLKSA